MILARIIHQNHKSAEFYSTFSLLSESASLPSHIDDMMNHFNDKCASAPEVAAPFKTQAVNTINPSYWINYDIHSFKREFRQAECSRNISQHLVHYNRKNDLISNPAESKK